MAHKVLIIERGDCDCCPAKGIPVMEIKGNHGEIRICQRCLKYFLDVFDDD